MYHHPAQEHIRLLGKKGLVFKRYNRYRKVHSYPHKAHIPRRLRVVSYKSYLLYGVAIP